MGVVAAALVVCTVGTGVVVATALVVCTIIAVVACAGVGVVAAVLVVCTVGTGVVVAATGAIVVRGTNEQVTPSRLYMKAGHC